MSDVTRILGAIEEGDPHAADRLLPLVYDELRRLAAQRLAREAPGQTLQPTPLVHEAYLRLVASGDASAPREQHWHTRGHFFAAEAEAMRRILIERARSKQRHKRGGGAQRQEFHEDLLVADDRVDELLAVHEALEKLEQHDPQAAALVKLRFFAGFEHQEAAQMLGLSRRAADRLWLLARTWLFQALADQEQAAMNAFGVDTRSDIYSLGLLLYELWRLLPTPSASGTSSRCPSPSNASPVSCPPMKRSDSESSKQHRGPWSALTASFRPARGFFVDQCRRGKYLDLTRSLPDGPDCVV